MSGNVWEWCRTKWGSKYEDYQPDNDPEGADGRVLRGGAFYADPDHVRCACRDWFDPDYRFNLIGFRVVVSPFL
jgi:formylglycine-generating enzyme required for sulfatase activity